MRTPTLLVTCGLLALGACAEPAISAAPTETVESVCADVSELAREIFESDTMLSARWITRTDQLGVRAAMIGTREGDELMEGLAWFSVGIEQVDVDKSLEGLDRIANVCL